MITLKERKEMEDAFKKAQKPWGKLLQKVEKAKSDFHNSCKTERTAANMERNASADSSLSPDQVIFLYTGLIVRIIRNRAHNYYKKDRAHCFIREFRTRIKIANNQLPHNTNSLHSVNN